VKINIIKSLCLSRDGINLKKNPIDDEIKESSYLKSRVRKKIRKTLRPFPPDNRCPSVACRFQLISGTRPLGGMLSVYFFHAVNRIAWPTCTNYVNCCDRNTKEMITYVISLVSLYYVSNKRRSLRKETKPWYRGANACRFRTL